MLQEAGRTIATNVWGALLLLSWLVFAFVYRELKKELSDERTSHQATRNDMLSELRSQNHISAGLLSLQESNRQTNLILDALSRQETRGRANG